MDSASGKHQQRRNGQASEATGRMACGRGPTPGPPGTPTEATNPERDRPSGRGEYGEDEAGQQQKAKELRRRHGVRE